MFTAAAKIDVRAMVVESGGERVSAAPLVVRNQTGKIALALPKSAAGYRWHEDDYLIIDCEAQQNSKANVKYEFKIGDKLFTMGYYLVPKRRVKMAIQLVELASRRWFLQTRPGAMKGHVSGSPTHIDKVDEVRITLEKGREPQSFTLYDAYLSRELPDFTVKGEPMVDQFGQWKDMDWAGKVKDEAAMVGFLRAEYDRALRDHDYPGDEFSRYGGWTKKRFEARGFFYKLHDGRRWWLVDPDGCAFFSNGVCYGSRMGVHGFVDGMEDLFDFLPPKDDPVFKDAWTTADQIPEFVKRNGAEAGKGRYMFNFARANMIRAFGDKWWDAWVTINAARLKRWGFNTISVCVNNYFDERAEDYLKKAGVPFTWTLKCFPKTREMVFRDFPDVFSPEYAMLCRDFAQQIVAFKDNPYFIGYFINNEPEWLVQWTTNPAEQLLRKGPECVSKGVLVEFMKEAYAGNIAALNATWATAFGSFDELAAPYAGVDALNDVARADLHKFRARMIEEYVRVPTSALKAVCPNALNLGMRYASVTENDFAGDTLFDMFSSNGYRRSVVPLLELVARCTKMPLVVGEWHYGGSDYGLLDNALVNATTQTERGKACANYLQMAMAAPNCVGVHYFEFNDQPLLGRFDGECMQHGLIDVCNQPHTACVEAMKAVNAKMYQYANGDIAAVETPWEFAQRF